MIFNFDKLVYSQIIIQIVALFITIAIDLIKNPKLKMWPNQQGGSQGWKPQIPKQGSSGWGDGWGDDHKNKNLYPDLNSQLASNKPSTGWEDEKDWGQLKQKPSNQGWGQGNQGDGWGQQGGGNQGGGWGQQGGGNQGGGWGQQGGQQHGTQGWGQGGNQGWGQGGHQQGNQGWGQKEGGNQGGGWGQQGGGNQGGGWGQQGGQQHGTQGWGQGGNQGGGWGQQGHHGSQGWGQQGGHQKGSGWDHKGGNQQGNHGWGHQQGKANRNQQNIKSPQPSGGWDIPKAQQNQPSIWNNQIFQQGFGKQLINFKAGDKYQANLASHQRCNKRVLNIGFAQSENNTPVSISIGSMQHFQPLQQIGILLPTIFPNPNIKYKILTVLDLNMCLDATSIHDPGKNLYKGNVIIWEYHGGPNQQYFIKSSGKFCRIYNAATGFALRVPNKLDKHGKTVPNSSHQNQVQLRTSPCQDIQSEQFQFVEKQVGNQKYYVIKTYCGKALDVAEQKKKNNTRVIQYDIHEGENQMWKIVPA